jgi:hypothetical protein
MRCEPFIWAGADTFATGPDIALNNKLPPTSGHSIEGYIRGVAPDVTKFNYMMHRFSLMRQAMGRMEHLNIYPLITAGCGYAAPYTMEDYCYDQVNGYHTIVYCSVVGNSVDEDVSPVDGEIWTAGLNIAAFPTTLQPSTVAIDCDGTQRRICTINDLGMPNVVRYSAAGAAWASCVLAAPPGGSNWISCRSDKNSAGGGTTWLIGQDGIGGTAAPVIFRSINGVNFANVAGFPALAVGQAIDFIGHTHHRAGALGPHDPGNPNWLVMTLTNAVRSPDGLVWTSVAHGIAGGMNKRSCAYSKETNRWLCLASNAGAAIPGTVYRSDDNGATWVLFSALPGVIAGTRASIVCDGYGTFVASDGVNYWVSPDNGVSWTRSFYPFALPGGIEHLLCVACDQSRDVDTPELYPSRVMHLRHDSAGPTLTAYSSLKT